MQIFILYHKCVVKLIECVNICERISCVLVYLNILFGGTRSEITDLQTYAVVVILSGGKKETTWGTNQNHHRCLPQEMFY